MDYSPTGSSVHGVLHARVGSHSGAILELVAIPFSSVSSLTKELNRSLLHFRQIIYHLRLLLIWIQRLLRNKRTESVNGTQNIITITNKSRLDQNMIHFRSVQSCLTLCDSMNLNTPGLPVCLLKLISTESVMPSSHLILCHPLLLLPSIPPSIRVFSSESTLCRRWPNYWTFSFSISPSNGHPGLISFRMDWLYLLAVQGTLKSLLQHHSSKASILRH